MTSASISKIERVQAPQQGSLLYADLYLNKNTGMFFSDVGGERVEAATKKEGVTRTQAALSRVSVIEWRQVIVLHVRKSPRDTDGRHVRSTHNNMVVLGASCSFTFTRRERAKNPLNKKETIERDHPEDFEVKVAEVRKREMRFGRWSLGERKKQADAVEKRMRDARVAMAHVSRAWGDTESQEEYEIPYTAEAWTGLHRIADTLCATQKKLDEFARGATPAALAALASGDVFKLLPPAPKRRK
jgi:hypothetical protein